jgi:hypothetical protein
MSLIHIKGIEFENQRVWEAMPSTAMYDSSGRRSKKVVRVKLEAGER